MCTCGILGTLGCGILGTLGCGTLGTLDPESYTCHGTLGTQDPEIYTWRGTLGTLDPEMYTRRGTLGTQDPEMYTWRGTLGTQDSEMYTWRRTLGTQDPEMYTWHGPWGSWTLIFCHGTCLIWTWLGQDIARVEFPHCHSVPWGHLRSATSDILTFTSNHIICDYNRFLRWWIRFEGFFCHLCVHGRYTNHMCVSSHGSVTS